MELTLDQLVAAVGERIAGAGLAQANGQVSPLPDRRTLRYYTTIGLLDRPLGVRDRQAVYGEGHVLQAVAVKRLQAEGLALAEIQARLSGLPMADVAAIADGRVLPARRAARFWADRPGGDSQTSMPPVAAGAVAWPPQAPPPQAPQSLQAPPPQSPPSSPPPPESSQSPLPSPLPPQSPPPGEVHPLLAVSLGRDVTVLLPAGRSLSLTAEQLAGIRHAAGPLLDHLEAAGLTGAQPKDRL